MSRVRATLQADCVLVYFPSDHVGVHVDCDKVFYVTAFVPLEEIDPLIAALQKASDKETARHYADSELVGSPKEEDS